MRYPLLRHTPATSLVGMLCLTASLLLAVVTVPASAATPAEDSGKSTAGVEIVIKSDDEVRTTFVTTAPASGEEILKKSCVEENFSQASSKIFAILVVKRSIATVLLTPSGMTISA